MAATQPAPRQLTRHVHLGGLSGLVALAVALSDCMSAIRLAMRRVFHPLAGFGQSRLADVAV
jgi:uncharacterized BrkB/YihY/UPF0761 family membrane protein